MCWESWSQQARDYPEMCMMEKNNSLLPEPYRHLGKMSARINREKYPEEHSAGTIITEFYLKAFSLVFSFRNYGDKTIFSIKCSARKKDMIKFNHVLWVVLLSW